MQYTVANVKRKKSIELSKGESLSLYRREHGARWESMETYELCCIYGLSP